MACAAVRRRDRTGHKWCRRAEWRRIGDGSAARAELCGRAQSV